MFHERFPALSLILRTVDSGDDRVVLYDTPDFAPSDFVQVYYVFGIGDGQIDQLFSGWLKADPNRQLVLLENNLARMQMLLENGQLDRIATNTQVHIEIFPQGGSIDQFAGEVVGKFKAVRVGFEAFGPYQRNTAMREAILREAFFTGGDVLENQHFKSMTAQWMENIRQLSGAACVNHLEGCFKGIPAVVLGAGPSLDRHAELLEQLQDRALIFAGGSALAALAKMGIEPHFCFVLDPNTHEFDLLRPATCFEGEFVTTLRTEKRLKHLVGGRRNHLEMLSLGALETEVLSQLGVKENLFCMGDIRGGMTVTTASIALARHLGCSTVVLAGVDLAFTDGRTYASGVFFQPKGGMAEIPFSGKTVEGKTCATLLKWLCEARWISLFAKAFPDFKLIQTAEDALAIAHVEYQPLEDVLTERLGDSFDLRGMVYGSCDRAKMGLSSEKVEKLLIGIRASASKCFHIIEKLPWEAVGVHLEGEVVYDTLLSYLDTKEQAMEQCLAICEEKA